MNEMSTSSTMRDRFEGCLVGALVGDCLGSPFEGMSWSSIRRSRIEDTIGVGSTKLKKKNKFCFTDDSAMTRSVYKSLIENKGFNASDLASKFLEEFKKESDRGYGGGMFIIFQAWKKYGTSKENVLVPAREQFGGSGSYGNGAAMRVAPVALFASTEEEIVKLAKDQALLTHTNKHGYNGAILQALSVYMALNSSKKIDKQDFLAELIRRMSHIEGVDVAEIAKSTGKSSGESDISKRDSNERYSEQVDFTFTSQLIKMSSMFENPDSDTDPAVVIDAFGNDISAQEAVIAALNSFLSNCDKNFTETLIYAIMLGGDTDTIATMACAMAGAYFGASSIPAEWTRVCEGLEDAKSFANQLFERRFPSQQSTSFNKEV